MSHEEQSQGDQMASRVRRSVSRDFFHSIARPILMALTFLLIFAAMFTAIFQDPRPRDVPVAVVGPETVVATVQAQIDNVLPGAFNLRAYQSPEEAVAAIEHRNVNAAFVTTSTESQLFIASAAGDATATAITAAFTAVAQGHEQPLSIHDIRPLPEHDSRGATSFFLVLSVVIASMLFQVIAATTGSAMSVTLRLFSLLCFALLVGFVAAGTTHWITRSIQDEFWSVTGLTALLALAVAGTAATLQRVLGTPGIALAGLTLIIVGVSTSGGPLSTDLLPGWSQSIAPWLPPGATVDALRNTLYFDANDVAAPITVLTLWILAAFTLLIAYELLRPGKGSTARAISRV